MKFVAHFCFAIFAISTSLASAQTGSVIAESRDASIAFLGTANFVVGRVGRDCLTQIGRNETPQTFVSVWQQRNGKYLLAMQKYLEARLAEAEVAGGVAGREKIMRELTIAVQTGANVILKTLLDHPDQYDACRRAINFIDAGRYDVNQSMPIYSELESLVDWAQR
jgi:hypothetical protein